MGELDMPREPADLAIIRPPDAIFDRCCRSSRAARFGIRLDVPVLGDDDVFEHADRHGFLQRQTPDFPETVGAKNLATLQIDFQGSNAGGALRQAETALAIGQCVFDTLPVIDIRIGADPLYHPVLVILERNGASNMPAEDTVLTAQAKLFLVGLPAGDCRGPFACRLVEVVGMNDSGPSCAVKRTGTRSGIFVDSRVEPVERAVRARRPDVIGHRLGDDPELRFDFTLARIFAQQAECPIGEREESQDCRNAESQGPGGIVPHRGKYTAPR